MSKIVYSSTVTAVGALVPEFAEQGVLVWFGENSPKELHDFSIIHSPDLATRAPRVGDLVKINENQFNVLAVGSVAEENLINLGHLDLKANGKMEAELPGDVNVEKVLLPQINVGDRLLVISPK